MAKTRNYSRRRVLRNTLKKTKNKRKYRTKKRVKKNITKNGGMDRVWGNLPDLGIGETLGAVIGIPSQENLADEFELLPLPGAEPDAEPGAEPGAEPMPENPKDIKKLNEMTCQDKKQVTSRPNDFLSDRKFLSELHSNMVDLIEGRYKAPPGSVLDQLSKNFYNIDNINRPFDSLPPHGYANLEEDEPDKDLKKALQAKKVAAIAKSEAIEARKLAVESAKQTKKAEKEAKKAEKQAKKAAEKADKEAKKAAGKTKAARSKK